MIVDGQEVLDERGRPVRDPAEIEGEAEFIRLRLAPVPQQGQIKTPDDIILDLEWSKHGTAKGALLIKDAERTWKALKHLHERGRAKARQATSAKSADLRDAEVFLATEETGQAADDAETVLNFAKNVSRSAESSQSAIQTQARMVEATFRMSGTGRDS